MQRFDDSYASAWNIVGIFPAEPDNIILSLEIFGDKSAPGVQLTEELNTLIADRKVADIGLEEQVKNQPNPLRVAELQQRQGDIEKKIGRVMTQLQQLRIPFVKLKKLKNFFAGKKVPKSDPAPAVEGPVGDEA